jgi:hypothetical protein
MSHAPSPRTTQADPGPIKLAQPIRLADSVPLPEDPRPEAKRGPTLHDGFERLLSINDLAALLNCSRRLIESMRAAGKVPKPDFKAGKMPRWRAETIRRWIEDGGKA